MAQPTNAYDTYDNVGIREDLSDMIWRISPTETPFITAAGRNKAKNTYHEWQTDSLAAAADNAHIEGDEFSGTAATPTVRIGNYTQIMKKEPVVTGTVEETDRAGRGREMALQVAKMTAEIKRDMERACVGVNNARVAGNSTTARELASVQAWINTNTSAGTGGADPTGDGTDARTDGTPRAYTEDLLKDVLQSIWTEGGNPGVIMVGAFNRRAMSAFTGNTTRFDDAKDKRLVTTYEVYVSDWGEHRIVPNRFSRTRDALCLDMDYWKISTLRPLRNKPIARTGDSEKRELLTEFTLEACNEGASGIVADLTTS